PRRRKARRRSRRAEQTKRCVGCGRGPCGVPSPRDVLPPFRRSGPGLLLWLTRMSDFVRLSADRPGIAVAQHESAGVRRLLVGLLTLALGAPLGSAAATPRRSAATA